MSSVLMAAGLRTVIASPWPIPDTVETADVMVALHRHLEKSASPPEAVAELTGKPIGGAFLVFGA